MSAHGIPPAWKQNSEFKFGEPWLFTPEEIIGLSTLCDLNTVGDVNPTNIILAFCDLVTEGDIQAGNTLSVGCSIFEPPPNVTNFMASLCDFDKVGDIDQDIDLDAICALTKVGDLHEGYDFFTFCTIGVFTPVP